MSPGEADRSEAVLGGRSAGHRLRSTSGQGRRILGPALIVLTGLVFFNVLWTDGGIIYSPHSDIISEHVSIKAVGRQALLQEGSLPAWNPSMNGGAPALANPQSMYAFPFDLLVLILPLDRAVNLLVLLNALLAGITMYVFSRTSLRSRWAAVFCALAYMLSDRFLAIIYAGWLPKLSMYALTPLLFWACRRVIRVPSARNVGIATGVWCLACLQGDMQQLYYTGIGCAIYAAVLVCRAASAPRARSCLGLAAAILLGTLLAAPVLLPRIEFAQLSTRAEPDYRFFLGRAPTWDDVETFADPRDESGQRDEFWESNFYFGIGLTPLWMIAILAGLRRAAPFVAAAAVMIFLCFDSPVLRWLFDYLPGFDLFRQSPRILLLAQFALVLLAGLGLDAMTDSRNGPNVRRLGSALMLCAVGLALAAAAGSAVNPTVPVCGLIAVAGLAVRLGPRGAGVALALVCVVPVLDAGVRMRPLITTKPLDEAFPRPAFYDRLNRDASGGRVLAVGRTSIPFGTAGYHEVDLINGVASLNLRHYVEYFWIMQYGDPARIPRHPVVWTDFLELAKPGMLHALNVRYIVANQPLPFERFGFDRIAEYEDVPVFVLYSGIEPRPMFLWKSTDPLGPAYFADRVRPIDSESQSLSALAAAPSVLTAHVFGLDGTARHEGSTGGSVELIRRELSRYEYAVDSSAENFLIISQIWHPDWRASLDGRPLRLYRTNHALLGCFVPADRHRLILSMTSPAFSLGMIPALATLAIVIGVAVLTRRRATGGVSRPADRGPS